MLVRRHAMTTSMVACLVAPKPVRCSQRGACWKDQLRVPVGEPSRSTGVSKQGGP